MALNQGFYRLSPILKPGNDINRILTLFTLMRQDLEERPASPAFDLAPITLVAATCCIRVETELIGIDKGGFRVLHLGYSVPDHIGRRYQTFAELRCGRVL